MNSCQLYVLHNSRNKSVRAVADGIRFTFQSVVQKTVDEDGAVGSDAYRGFHVVCHARIVIYTSTAAAAQPRKRGGP